ncbi:MAG TPA: hypothetical protein VMU10_02520, partial [Desulfomonilia bacterium]|nr:hypothetical protein [Desulfomonilia bacterium]
GFLALFGTLNLIALPVVLAVSAFTLFSLAYVKHLNSGLYIISYILAALAAATGGYFLLLFILLAGLMLILLDLEPSKLFSIHLLTGLAIIGCSMTAYFLSYRFLLGPGFSGGAFSVGEHLGLFRSIYAIITYASPWVFLVIPAWLYGGGPSEQETWRKLLPSRIAIVMVFFMLWVSSSGLPQYATILMMFAAPLIGCWISRGIFFGSQKSTFGFWMMVLSGIVVFASALVLLLLPLRYGFALHAEQLIAGAGLLTATLLFIIFTVQRKMAAQFTLIVIAVVSVVGDLAFLSPEDQWDRKLSYMEGISINTPLVVYEDDLVMRGYMSRVNASPMIVDRDIVPFHGTAFIAVSTADLGGFLDGLKGRMRSVVLETYRAENTYALVMISPKKKGD